MTVYRNPVVIQRADPWVLKTKEEYFFTASYPSYDRIILRRAATLNGLQSAAEKTVWWSHSAGPMSKYVWAPELHRIDGVWYIYFAAAERGFEPSGLPTHRTFVLENRAKDPMSTEWHVRGQIVPPIASFSPDATPLVHSGAH